MTTLAMYVGMVNSPEATLAASVTIDAMVIPVTDTTVFPATGNGLATIGADVDAETILYAYKTTSSGPGDLIVIQRGFNISGTYGVAKAWDAGEIISRQVTEYDLRAATTNIEILQAQIGSWAAFDATPVWPANVPTILSTVARAVRNGNVVTFAITYVISEGNDADLPTIPLPVAASQTANYRIPLTAFKSFTKEGVTNMSDPHGYIDFTEATPVIKFSQAGSLPDGATAELRISGSYEVA